MLEFCIPNCFYDNNKNMYSLRFPIEDAAREFLKGHCIHLCNSLCKSSVEPGDLSNIL